MKHSHVWAWVSSAGLGLGALPAAAVDVSVSGFGTLGYAQSDQTFNYQTHVNDRGTLKRDSVLGLQMDARLNDQFSVTLQAKAAPSVKRDEGVDATVSWAFLSWRPTNDLLFRAGRLRVPLYLQSENTDVGATFSFARLPTEVYSTTPTTDFNGVSFSKTWGLAAGDLTLDGYLGETEVTFRTQLRDLAVVAFSPTRVSARGLALTFQQDDHTFRIGAHDAYAKSTNGQGGAETYPFVALAPGVGYYQIAGPGVKPVTEAHSPVFTLGANLALGQGTRLMGEYVRRDVRNLMSGSDTQGAYLAVLKRMGAWTPYLSVGRLLTMAEPRQLYNQINANRLPNGVPGAELINPTQRLGADILTVYDQTTWALGTAYRVSPSSNLKAEWARVSVGAGSSFIDAPAGAESGNKVTNVLSVSYNFVF